MCWYNFLNNDLNYIHETHHHGSGAFGFGYNYTSKFEKKISSIYGIMQRKNFQFFSKESKLRFNIKEKLEILKSILKEI